VTQANRTARQTRQDTKQFSLCGASPGELKIVPEETLRNRQILAQESAEE
jgi:hypothetical protein